MKEEYIHIVCSCCKNKQLFDLMRGSKGIVSIKCPICRVVVAVSPMAVKLAIIKNRSY